MAPAGRPALLYDDGCRFCRACVQGVRRCDRGGRFDILPWSDAEAADDLRNLTPALRDCGMHLRDADGRLHSQDDALLALLALLPGGDVVAGGARRLPPLRWALARGYDLVARNRASLSRLVPDTSPTTRRAGSPPGPAAR